MMKYSLLCLLLFSFISFSCRSKPSEQAVGKNDTDANETQWALLPFVKVDSVNPVLDPGTSTFICPIRKKEIAWEAKNVFNPAVTVRNDTMFMLYRAQDSIGKPGGTSRIGLAWSIDGMHFIRMPSPVLYPANDAYKKYEWEGGCEDPRLVEDSSGLYYMTYTAFEGTTARLLMATSTDLVHWTKYGSVFAKAYNGKYKDVWSKSGAIVSAYKDGKIIATKINGKYWMYWGDKYLWLATSDDLINWTPIETNGETQPYDSVYAGFNITSLKIVLPTRKGMFDADLVESGPPAMLTDKGILLFYNGRNVRAIGDTTLAEGAYTSAQVLFDINDPSKIIKRMDHYFMKPEQPYELTGEVNQVCFIEGLTQYKNKWWLYYGTADSKVAVAVKE
ncbi:MAG: glycoside hydrolase family 130 protein [Panacibacter sp.]